MKLTFAITGVGSVALLSLSFLLFGCHNGMRAAEPSTTESATPQPVEADTAEVAVVELPDKGGAQLWSQNCMRCHNLRPPRERSDRQWEIIVHHMRVRANLTAQEHRLILAFLKAAN